MSLYIRSLKLSLAAGLAIYLASLLGLQYATSAGIIAILSVQDTRRTSFRVARQRLGSTLLALGLGSLAFCGLGFSIWGIMVYMLVYVPLAYHWHLELGIAPSTVLVTHLYLEKSLSLIWQRNELLLFILGAGVALFLNLYMPSQDQAIRRYHEQVEGGLKAILLRFQSFLLQGDGYNEAILIGRMEETLRQALKLVYQEEANQIFHRSSYQVAYFEMRMKQTEVLRQMAVTIRGLALKTTESVILAQLFEEVGSQLSQANSGHLQLKDIDDFLLTFRQRPLPKTRQEFENRAILFQLLNDMRRFIDLKVTFYETQNLDQIP